MIRRASGTLRGGELLRDPAVVALARRAEPVLWLAALLLLYAGVVSTGLERLLYIPAGVSLGLTLALHRYAGVPGYSLLRWLSALTGLALATGALGILLLGILLFTRGSFGILGGLMAVPIAVGMGAAGWSLLIVTMSRRPGAQAMDIDLDAARASEAVKRFDALHRPGAPGPEEPPPP